MFAGVDKKENGDRAWSSYVELAYPFSVGSVVSEKYEIPLFVQLAVNPQLNYMNLVIGLSF